MQIYEKGLKFKVQSNTIIVGQKNVKMKTEHSFTECDKLINVYNQDNSSSKHIETYTNFWLNLTQL